MVTISPSLFRRSSMQEMIYPRDKSIRNTSPENRIDMEAKLIFPARRCKYLCVDGPLQSSPSDDEDHNVIVFAGTTRNSFSRLLRFLHTSATLYILRLESISRWMSSRFLTSQCDSLSCISGKAPSVVFV